MNPEPQIPANLHPLAGEILDEFEGNPSAGSIVLGGGVALQHYCPYRETVDLDAWWATDVADTAEELVQRTMRTVAGRHGLDLSVRAWRETKSFELKLPGGKKKRFSFQISRRTIQLEPPLESAWPPVRIESLTDNLASKMNALVDRGAPRDILDIYQVCQHGLATPEHCWELWRRKNPSAPLEEARLRVLHHLQALKARRPLDGIQRPMARAAARAVREWVGETLCTPPDSGPSNE